MLYPRAIAEFKSETSVYVYLHIIHKSKAFTHAATVPEDEVITQLQSHKPTIVYTQTDRQKRHNSLQT